LRRVRDAEEVVEGPDGVVAQSVTRLGDGDGVVPGAAVLREADAEADRMANHRCRLRNRMASGCASGFPARRASRVDRPRRAGEQGLMVNEQVGTMDDAAIQEASHAALTPLSFLVRSVAVFPGKTAAIDGERSVTWSEFATHVTKAAGALRAAGIER